MSRLILPNHQIVPAQPSVAPPMGVNLKLGRQGNQVVMLVEVVGQGAVTVLLTPDAWRHFAAAGNVILDAIELVELEHPVPAEAATDGANEEQNGLQVS